MATRRAGYHNLHQLHDQYQRRGGGIEQTWLIPTVEAGAGQVRDWLAAVSLSTVWLERGWEQVAVQDQAGSCRPSIAGVTSGPHHNALQMVKSRSSQNTN